MQKLQTQSPSNSQTPAPFNAKMNSLSPVPQPSIFHPPLPSNHPFSPNSSPFISSSHQSTISMTIRTSTPTAIVRPIHELRTMSGAAAWHVWAIAPGAVEGGAAAVPFCSAVSAHFCFWVLLLVGLALSLVRGREGTLLVVAYLFGVGYGK